MSLRSLREASLYSQISWMRCVTSSEAAHASIFLTLFSCTFGPKVRSGTRTVWVAVEMEESRNVWTEFQRKKGATSPHCTVSASCQETIRISNSRNCSQLSSFAINSSMSCSSTSPAYRKPKQHPSNQLLSANPLRTSCLKG